MGVWYTVTAPDGSFSIDFNNTDGNGVLIPDLNGTVWSVEELLGWDSADVREVTLDKYGEDGIALGVNEFSSRTLTLSNGFGAATSEDERYTAQYRLAQCLAATKANGPCLVTVHEEIDRFVYGYKPSKHNFRDAPEGTGAGSLKGVDLTPFQFEASLICIDPLKHSINGNSPLAIPRDGSVIVPTTGDYPTWPVLNFAYPADGDYIINEAGLGIVLTNQFRGNSNANMPDELHVDLAARTAVDGTGASAWDCIETASFFQLKSNGESFVQYHLGSTSPLGTQNATISWEDAWL